MEASTARDDLTAAANAAKATLTPFKGTASLSDDDTATKMHHDTFDMDMRPILEENNP